MQVVLEMMVLAPALTFFSDFTAYKKITMQLNTFSSPYEGIHGNRPYRQNVPPIIL